jgi:riboflavin kinase/FMN adenylyltransferase
MACTIVEEAFFNMRMIMLSLDCEKVPQIPMCACIGYFDGMHRGHQALIAETVAMAKEKDAETAMITFDPDPWVTIKGLQNVKHITTIRQRINKAVSFGIENIVVLKFTKEMAQLSPEDFVTKVLGKLNLKGIVCGFDFHYGSMGMGSSETLQKDASYDVKVVGEVDDETGKISSTRISQCISEGDMEQASEMLGYYYSIEGVVVHGRQLGTEIGFPTANIDYSEEYLLPKPGVYACIAHIGGRKYRAMANLGHNPTFNYRQNLSLEAYLLDFDGDIYENTIRLDFVHFMREEMSFRSKENLILQLEQDVRNVRKMIDQL